jgi:Polyketide cyclase / dehydrase and lipid transport
VIGGSASVEIEARLEEVWAVLQDVMAAPEWQGGLDTVTALERDTRGRPTLLDTELDIKVRRVRSRIRICYEEPTRLWWTQVQGDVKSAHAVWELEDLGNGRTRAFYRFDADPGRALGLIIRGPVQAATRAILIDRRPGELKRRVESG